MPTAPLVQTVPAQAIAITVYPGQDVHLRTGLALGALRDAVAEVTGRDELRRAQLHVDDRALDDHHVAGQAPLVSGATLRCAPEPPDPTASALETPFHVAHLAGPRAGFVHPVVLSPTVSTTDLVLPGVRVLTRAGRRDTIQVRIRSDTSSQVALVDGGGRTRRVRRTGLRRWTVWKPGTTLEVAALDGTTTSRTELRCRPRLTDVTFSALIDDLREDPRGRAVTARPATRSTAVVLLTALLPAVASVALAVALRNPLFAVMAVIGPLMVLGPHLAHRRQARRLGAAPAMVPTDRSPSRPCPRAGLRPVDLLTAALASSVEPRQDLLVRNRDRTVPPRRLGAERTMHDRLVGPGHLRGGCLAVVGPRSAAIAHLARMVVALHATGRSAHIVVLASPDRVPTWAWARWLPGSTAVTPAPDRPLPSRPGTLLVVDTVRTPELNAQLGAWHAAHGEQSGLLVLADDSRSVPSWCSAVAAVTAQTVTWTAPGHPVEHTPFEGVGPRWLDDYARKVSALASTGRWSPEGALGEDSPALDARGRSARPGAVPLVDALTEVLGAPLEPGACLEPGLLHVPGALVDAIADRWTSDSSRALCAAIGVGDDGLPVSLDLLADGPHALVAGTTGAGKSEFLQTLVLTLALRSSPDDLAIALVDYKGGAGFGACTDLPHVVGLVTDLDPGIAERALDGLRAELRRRERLFSAVGAANLDSYRACPEPPERLPRLLVVVDEFRAMADDHPQFIPGLVRIAAQGRSLGVHLVLATQRPSGAITPDMRANISVRVALRVVDDADSIDIIDAPGAASIPADAPGRALVRRGLAALETVQTYHSGGHASGAAHAAWATPRWDVRDPDPTWSFPPSPGPSSAPSASRGDAARQLVDAARATARALRVERPRVPWTPDLPTHTTWEELDVTTTTEAATGTGTSLLLGIADHPEDQRHEPCAWDVDAGHLLVVGRAGTGRTTALRTVAHAARETGYIVHLVGPATLVPDHRTTLATVTSSSDPRCLARLLTLLLSASPSTGSAETAVPVKHVLVIDGLEDAQRTLSSMHRGAGAELLTSLLRDGIARGIHVAVSAAGTPSTTVSALFSQRLLLSGREKHDDAYLGIPSALAGRGGAPGRAVLLGSDTPVRCQVAVVDTGVRSLGDVEGTRSSEIVRWTVEPIPRTVSIEDLLPADGTLMALGTGGDRATTVGLRHGQSILVCGPHGSGRSSALALATRAAAARSEVIAVLSRDPMVLGAAAEIRCGLTLADSSPHATARFLESLAATTASRARVAAGTPDTAAVHRVIVVDDLDALAQTSPGVPDTLQRLVEADPGIVVVASATTASAAGAFRGLLADLRATRCGIVLAPGTPGSSEVFGIDLGWFVEPDVHAPGRGALVDGRDVSLVQIAHAQGVPPRADLDRAVVTVAAGPPQR